MIAAHNEEDVIEAKLENALALDYPASGSHPGRLRRLDRPHREIVERFADRGVELSSAPAAARSTRRT